MYFLPEIKRIISVYNFFTYMLHVKYFTKVLLNIFLKRNVLFNLLKVIFVYNSFSIIQYLKHCEIFYKIILV